MATKEQLIGLDDSKLVNIKDDPRRMSVLMCDRDAAKALPDLFSDAFDKGFELRIASAYRSFYKQFKIFDDKFKVIISPQEKEYNTLLPRVYKHTKE